ncbi:MAG TPA: hypothetical protein VFI59_15985 [Actinomycetota bacterium]|nr:hypothetical protein [Actinomycetota bacterium]
MERLKRNPAGWGLVLGGAVVSASTLLTWFVVEGGGGDERIRAIEAVSGQTILFLGVAALICGVLVMISLGGGKYVWATLGLLASGVALAAAIWGVVDTEGLAARFADVEAFSTLITFSADASRGDTVTQAFEDGSVSARPAIGMFVALAGGLLAIAGALLSYRYTPPVADRTTYEREG